MPRYAAYLLLGMLAARLRVSLPSIQGTLPLNFLFVLFGVAELTLPEMLLMACGMSALQSCWKRQGWAGWLCCWRRVSAIALATAAAQYAFTATAVHAGLLLGLLVAATVFYAVEIALNRGAGTAGLRRHYPYYLAGACAAALMSAANRYVGWQTALLVMPVLYLIYRSYRLYLGRLDDERRHAEEMAALHLRTIEALALAIDAKDHSAHDHLQRVQIYALELGRELGLKADEMEALRAASLLHDIGKLAVPEHITSKPGRLTPEEFDKMKIHPVVGAEILERVEFPYPVASIVHSHHERWDGSGYPEGLSGERIPIGARILAAVDCLDALASDRQYRRGLPLDEAMRTVRDEGGKTFDPRVVEALSRRYVELERRAQEHQRSMTLSTGVTVTRGSAPGAGYERAAANGSGSPDFLECIAAARQEVQALFELAQDLGNSLSLQETLSLLAVRLRGIIPCDSIVMYVLRDDVLVPEYVSGDEFKIFSSLAIPSGQGLSGWVAENAKPILNGNPSVEPGYVNQAGECGKQRSALAVPLEGLNGVLGVLSLYHAAADAFTKDHLRILLAISSKVALSIENALRYRQAEDSATNDFLTSLPNARGLFVHLEAEMARARRSGAPVAVLVTDLDGFKRVNDRLGHLQGNELLRSVALGLKDSCREYDYVARMGGDEFVLVLPGLTPESFVGRREILEQTVADAADRVSGAELVGISIGEAFFPQDGTDAEQLLAEADRRMYLRKRSRKLAAPLVGAGAELLASA